MGGWERDGEQGVADGDGEGEVEGIAGDAAALVEAVSLIVGGEGGEGLDEGGAGGGVKEEEVGEGVGIGGGGVFVVDVVKEGGVDGAAGDGGVGVDDVEEVVDEVGVALGDELHVVDGGVAAGGGVAKLAQGFEEGSAVAGDSAGDAAGDVAAEDVVAAEGSDGSDLGDGGGVGAIRELFALARAFFGAFLLTVKRVFLLLHVHVHMSLLSHEGFTLFSFFWPLYLT